MRCKRGAVAAPRRNLRCKHGAVAALRKEVRCKRADDEEILGQAVGSTEGFMLVLAGPVKTVKRGVGSGGAE